MIVSRNFLVHRILDTESFSETRETTSDWSHIPFYAVGKSTAAALRDIQSLYPHSPFVPKDIRGEGSGTGESLAHFILDNLHGMIPDEPMLFLTGDKNRDVLPKILENGGVKLKYEQVYETKGSTTFALDLEDVLANRFPKGMF